MPTSIDDFDSKLSGERINFEFYNGINPYKIKKGRKASLIYTNHLKPIIFIGVKDYETKVAGVTISTLQVFSYILHS